MFIYARISTSSVTVLVYVLHSFFFFVLQNHVKFKLILR